MTSEPRWRQDAPPDLVVLAAGKCAAASLRVSEWAELGLLTLSREELDGHPRLYRALRFGDDDYQSAVFDVMPRVLGSSKETSHSKTLETRFPNLEAVCDYLKLPDWLRNKEPALFSRLFEEDGTAGHAATLPDGTVLDAAEAAASRLEVAEMRRQVERIRRDYSEDAEASIGQAKELVESACKTILGLSGTGPETQLEVPALVAKTLQHLGLHPQDIDGADATEAKALKRVFGGLASVVQGAAELRNTRGTGHGRTGVPVVDPSLARMTVGMVLAAVVYLCERYERHMLSEAQGEPASAPAAPATKAPTPERPHSAPMSELRVGSEVAHATYGQGTVTALEGSGTNLVAKIDFGPADGIKRLLVRYSDLVHTKLPAAFDAMKREPSLPGPQLVTYPTAGSEPSRQRLSTVVAGQQVWHAVYGVGTVIKVEGQGANLVASVTFGPAEGTKRLLVRYSPLHPVKD